MKISRAFFSLFDSSFSFSLSLSLSLSQFFLHVLFLNILFHLCHHYQVFSLSLRISQFPQRWTANSVCLRLPVTRLYPMVCWLTSTHCLHYRLTTHHSDKQLVHRKHMVGTCFYHTACNAMLSLFYLCVSVCIYLVSLSVIFSVT